MSKKRNKSKYPGLDPKVNLKSRRFFIDNRYYMDELPDFAKEYLSDFNQAYYGNDRKLKYENFGIIDPQIEKEDYQYLKQKLSEMRAKRRKVWNKDANTTTDEDRQEAYVLTTQIDELSEYLDKMVPTRKMSRDNKKRPEDLLTKSSMDNSYKIVSWEDLKDSELNEILGEGIFLSPIEWEDED